MYNFANTHQTQKHKLNTKKTFYCKSIQEYQGFALTIYAAPRLMITKNEQLSIGEFKQFPYYYAGVAKCVKIALHKTGNKIGADGIIGSVIVL